MYNLLETFIIIYRHLLGGIMKKNKLKDLIKITKPPIWALIVGLILSLFGTISGLIIPLIVKQVIENMSSNIYTKFILPSVIIVALWILSSILSVYLLQYVGIKVVKDLRTKLWHKLLNLPVKYYDMEHSGELISRVINDTTVLKELLSFKIVDFITGIITIIGSTVILFLIDVPMTLVLILGIPLVALVVVPIGSKLYKIAVNEQEEMASLTSLLSQTLSEIRLIKAYGSEDVEFYKGENNFKNLFKYGMKTAKIESILTPLIMCFAMLIFIFVISFGAYRVSVGAVSSGDLIAFLLYLFQFVAPVATVGSFFSSVQKTKGATERLHNILMEDEEDLDNGEEILNIEKISFKDVNYSYENKHVLKGISFDAKKGETIAIVGPSGVGKSTIFALMEQFLKPDSGSILANDCSLDKYSIRSWRNKISYVQQDSPLLMGSIKENMIYGIEKDISFEELKNAAILAGAYDFIEELPQKFDTIIGERGRNLSGGQKQRIAVARAILRNPDILLFDEATASLDTKSEKIIQESVNKVKNGKIVFVIAHRLSTVVDSDKILVMQDGKITGCGAHQELLSSHEFYNNLVNQQFVENKESV